MPSLFEIGEELTAIYAQVDDLGGELPPELETWLQSVENDEAVKLDAYILLIRQAEMESAAASEEAERWMARANARNNFIKQLKERAKQHLERTGRKALTTATGRKLAVQNNGGKVPLTLDPVDIETLDPQFIAVKKVIDTEAIRTAIESGRQLDFARLEERGTHLRIR